MQETYGEMKTFRDLEVGGLFRFAVRQWATDGTGNLEASWYPNPVAGLYRKFSPATYCNTATPDRILSASPEGGSTSIHPDSAVIPVRPGNEDAHP